MNKRPLTSGEDAILRIVQEEYGPQNLDQDLSFTPANEAHLVINSHDGQFVTAISLTAFAHAMEGGQVSEQELRNDWIRDSRSIVNQHWNTNPSLFRLASTGGPDSHLVLIAGARKIELWDEQHCCKNTVEYVLYPNSMRKWEYPFHVEPITKSLREDLLQIVIKLLEAAARDENAILSVRIEW